MNSGNRRVSREMSVTQMRTIVVCRRVRGGYGSEAGLFVRLYMACQLPSKALDLHKRGQIENQLLF